MKLLTESALPPGVAVLYAWAKAMPQLSSLGLAVLVLILFGCIQLLVIAYYRDRRVDAWQTAEVDVHDGVRLSWTAPSSSKTNGVRSSRSQSSPGLASTAASLRSESAKKCIGWHGEERSAAITGLLVVVKTAPGNAGRRRLVRTLWAAKCARGELFFPSDGGGAENVRCVFVVGGGDSAKRRSLDEEQRQHGDLILAPMVDTYGTMTSKTMWTLQWSIRSYCFRHLMMIDDDAVVLFSRLLPFLSTTHAQRQSNFYTGHSHWGHLVYHCKVKPHPNCVDPTIYPATKFPPFASGFSYILSRDAVEKAVQMALVHVSQPLTLPGNTEDAMVAHVLAEAGVHLQNHRGFLHWQSTEERCPAVSSFDKEVVVVGNADDYVLQQVAENDAKGVPLCSGL